MPRLIKDTDLSRLANEGKLPKGFSVTRKDIRTNDANLEAELKVMSTIMAKIVKEISENTQTHTLSMQALMERLSILKEVFGKLSVEDLPKHWTQANIAVTERDNNGDIKTIEFKKVM